MMYLNDWKESGRKGVLDDFNEYGKDVDFLEGFDVLLASYIQESYEGYAFLLLRKGSEIYEINASHCSCFGLEGQFQPEETTVESMRHRLDEGSFGTDYRGVNEFADELREVLDRIDTFS